MAVGWDFFLAIANTQETITVRVRSRQNSSDIKVRNLSQGRNEKRRPMLYRPPRATSRHNDLQSDFGSGTVGSEKEYTCQKELLWITVPKFITRI